MLISKVAPMGAEAEDMGIILVLCFFFFFKEQQQRQLMSHLASQMRTLLGLILNPSYGKPSRVGSPFLPLAPFYIPPCPSPC